MILLSYILYFLGDLTSRFIDLIAHFFPRANWIFDFLYPIYCRLMGWSCELDKGEKIWLFRHEGETEEAFEERVQRKWPKRGSF